MFVVTNQRNRGGLMNYVIDKSSGLSSGVCSYHSKYNQGREEKNE